MDKSVCFTGHRHIGKHRSQIEKTLLSVIEQLIVQRNVTDFYVGGAYGFDALASLTVLRIKETYPQVNLHMVLPCSNEEQTANWSKEQKNEFSYILAHADSIEYNLRSFCHFKNNKAVLLTNFECCAIIHLSVQHINLSGCLGKTNKSQHIYAERNRMNYETRSIFGCTRKSSSVEESA